MAETTDRPAVSASSRAAMQEWQRAYEAYPAFAAKHSWSFVTDVLETYPGERVYEVGFGSGSNLFWARAHGWEVAGCEVADTALNIAKFNMPEGDFRKESIVDCSAPSGSYDVVIDRAACSNLSRKDMERAVTQVWRILKPGGVFFFNPYGDEHTRPFPDCMPPQTYWKVEDARRLFSDDEWELLSFEGFVNQYVGDPEGIHEHTLRIVVRKIGGAS